LDRIDQFGLRSLADAYLRHLGDRDIELLGGNASRRAELAQTWRANPQVLAQRLSDKELFESLFDPEQADRAFLIGASPFLVFAVAVHRIQAELGNATYVTEWMGLRQRLPVFDVAGLRDFLDSGWRRLFLAELLSSYTHVASGSVMVHTQRGWRRQRFSELDPVRLASLMDVVSEVERPGILRRLGDLALFLTGVFPDHIERRGFGPIEEARLMRAASVREGQGLGDKNRIGVAGYGSGGAVELLEMLGKRWYQLAYELIPRPVPADVGVLAELAERFDQARRILNVVTERHLFNFRERWFGRAG
jgi:hypothetical protein